MSKGMILVVDDDRSTCRFISKVLTENGFEVETANEAEAALQKVEQQHFDLAVLDFRLPGLNGAELCRKIREKQTGLPTVFLTGYPTIDTVFPAVDAGAERVLAKPVSVEELLTVIDETLGAAPGRKQGK